MLNLYYVAKYHSFHAQLTEPLKQLNIKVLAVDYWQMKEVVEVLCGTGKVLLSRVARFQRGKETFTYQKLPSLPLIDVWAQGRQCRIV